MKNMLRIFFTLSLLAFLFSCSTSITESQKGSDSTLERDESAQAVNEAPQSRAAINLALVAGDNSNLSYRDMDIFYEYLDYYDSNYHRKVRDTSASASETKSYLKQDHYALYFTGHGYSGGISCTDYSLSQSSIGKINVQHVIYATCSTCASTSWKYSFNNYTKDIMGYTSTSWDGTDNSVAKWVARYKQSYGYSFPYAWYKANDRYSSVDDRWCVYVREGSSSNIREYSARTGNIPSRNSVSDLRPMAENVKVSNALLTHTARSRKNNYTLLSSESDVQERSKLNKIVGLKGMNKDQKTALAEADRYVRANALLPADGSFDKVTAIYREDDVVGYTVRYKRTINGMEVRSIGLADYISILVTQDGVVSQSKYWPEISRDKRLLTSTVLTAAEAIRKAVPEINRRIKGGNVAIVGVEDCLGVKRTTKNARSLVPAYKFITEDGRYIVINAVDAAIL